MIAKVRCLVFDVAPLWAIFMLILYGVIGMMDWLALTWPPIAPMFLWAGGMAFCVPAILAQAKAPMWRILPLTPRERARALWWLAQGGPMLILGGLMALLAAVAAATGRLQIPPADALACVGGQFAVGSATMAAALATTALRRWLGVAAALLFFLPVLVAIQAAAIVGVPPALFDRLLIPAGALALAGAAASYVAAEKIALILPSSAPFETRARSGNRRGRPRPSGEKGRVVGWLTLLRPMGLVFVTAVAMVAGVQVALSQLPHRGGGHPDPLSAIMIAVIAGALPAGAANFVVRVLRSLPLGPAALTVVLQGSLSTFTLALFAAMQLMFVAVGKADAELWLAALAALPLTALRLPLHLRLGPQGGIFVGFALLIALPFLATTDFAPAPVLAAIDLTLWALAWAWTWWELARGRAAYRTWYVGAMRWRGGPS